MIDFIDAVKIVIEAEESHAEREMNKDFKGMLMEFCDMFEVMCRESNMLSTIVDADEDGNMYIIARDFSMAINKKYLEILSALIIICDDFIICSEYDPDIDDRYACLKFKFNSERVWRYNE